MTRRVILTILCLNILKQTSLTTLCRILPRLDEKVYPIFAKFLNNFPSIYPKFWKKYTRLEICAGDQNRSLSIWAQLVIRNFEGIYKNLKFRSKNTIFGFQLSKNIKNTQKNILQVSSRLIAFSNLTKRNYVTLRNFNRSIRTIDGVWSNELKTIYYRTNTK